jgi:hypothetical protein
MSYMGIPNFNLLNSIISTNLESTVATVTV